MTHYAHTAQLPDGSPDSNESHWQPLRTHRPTHPGHLDNVADLAAKFAAAFGAADWARLAGRWHDLGKYSAEFQRYLLAAGGAAIHLEERPEISAKIDHSTAGAQHATHELQLFGPILAYLIAGHPPVFPTVRTQPPPAWRSASERASPLSTVPQSHFSRCPRLRPGLPVPLSLPAMLSAFFFAWLSPR